MTGERKDGFRVDSDGAVGVHRFAARLSLHATLRARPELVAIEHPMHSLAGWLAVNSADQTTGHLRGKAATKLPRPRAPTREAGHGEPCETYIVTDDFPAKIAISSRELDVIEAFLGALLDDLLK